MIGHHWATLPITAREKESDNLLDTTLNRMWDHMTLGCIPTPPGGNAAIYSRSDLYCTGKISASTSQQENMKIAQNFSATAPTTDPYARRLSQVRIRRRLSQVRIRRIVPIVLPQGMFFM